MATYKTVTSDELKNWMDQDEDFTLIDVLSEGSYEKQHLPGAQHADVYEPDFLDKVQELVKDQDQPVVVYCSSVTCQRSPTAAEKLATAGYSDVYDFQGGLAEWQDAGYQLEAADK